MTDEEKRRRHAEKLAANGAPANVVNSVSGGVTTPTASNLPYTGGTPTASNLPYTGGTPSVSKLPYTGSTPVATTPGYSPAPAISSSGSAAQTPKGIGSVVQGLKNQGMIGGTTGSSATSSPVASSTAAGGSGTTTYYDRLGNKLTGYIIGGKTYTDPQGKNEIPVGSYVVAADGRVYNKQAAGSDLVWSPYGDDYAAYDNSAAIAGSGEFNVPGYGAASVAYEPRSGRYTVYDSKHNSIGYLDNAGNFHTESTGSVYQPYNTAVSNAAKSYLAGKGIALNGSGRNTIAQDYQGIYATGDDFLRDTFNHNNLMQDYWDDLQGGGNGADVLANYGYAYDDHGVAHYVGGGTGSTGAAGALGDVLNGRYNPATGGVAGSGNVEYNPAHFNTDGTIWGGVPRPDGAANTNGNTVNYGGLDNGRPEYDPRYQQQIDDLLNGLINYGDYDSPYAKRINDVLGQIENYGPYESEYADQLRDALNGITGYGPYDSPYAQRIEDALSAIEGRGPFSYDLESDPAWQAYRKQYTREGRRATEDTLGQYAAMTGGVPSTAAMTAAGQMGNYYNAQMTDKIPELYRMAYEMYLNEGNQMQQNLSNLRALDNDAYGRYGDTYNRMLTGYDALRGADQTAYGRWNDAYGRLYDELGALNQQDQTAYGRWADEYNRGLQNLDATRALENDNYGRYRDSVGDWESDRAFDYNANQDQLEWDYRNRAYADSRADTAWEQAYKERAYQDSRADTDWSHQWDEAELAARYGDTSKLSALGVTSNDGTQLYAYGDGDPYEIGSGKGKYFVTNAPNGSQMVGGDGSRWYKDQLGNVTITRGGKTWTIQAADPMAALGGGSWRGSANNDTGDTGDSGDYSVNMGDVEALGYGPISASNLWDKVNSGEVVAWVENGEWRFKRAKEVSTTPSVTDAITGRWARLGL